MAADEQDRHLQGFQTFCEVIHRNRCHKISPSFHRHENELYPGYHGPFDIDGRASGEDRPCFSDKGVRSLEPVRDNFW